MAACPDLTGNSEAAAVACGVGSPPLWSCKHAGQAVRFPAPTERSARQAGSVVAALAGISSYTRLPVGGRDSPREAVTEGSLGLTFLIQVGLGGGRAEPALEGPRGGQAAPSADVPSWAPSAHLSLWLEPV